MTQRIGDCVVPYGFEVWADGVYSVSPSDLDDDQAMIEPDVYTDPPPERRGSIERISRSGLWIDRRALHLGTGERWIDLARMGADRRAVSRWVPRRTLAHRQAIVDLAAHDFPIDSENAREIVIYLSALIAANPELPDWTLSPRVGAVEDRGWLVGRQWIGDETAHVDLAPDSERSSYVAGLRPSGDLSTWRERLVWLVGRSALARWLTFSTFASPLLRLLGHRTFVIHHHGDSGTGKTACARFALSAWGAAQELEQHMNRTQGSFIELFAACSDLPVLFDEKQAASASLNFGEIVMTICLERGRERSKQYGGLADTIRNWRAVVRFTGESEIIGNDSIDLGGQGNRVLQFKAAALSGADALALNIWCEQSGCYGTAGPEFLRRLRATPLPEIVELQTEIRKRILDRLACSRGRAEHFVLLAVAQTLAVEWLIGAERRAALYGACTDALEVAQLVASDGAGGAAVRPFHERALDFLRSHLASSPRAYLDLGRDLDRARLGNADYHGIVGLIQRGDLVEPADRGVWYLQAEVNALLKRAGFPPSRVWSDLAEHGYLHRESISGGFSAVRKIGLKSARVYVLHRRAS